MFWSLSRCFIPSKFKSVPSISSAVPVSAHDAMYDWTLMSSVASRRS
jgi:hypothetical protein